ncbi:MAG: hypothetical protein GY715_02365 [Planctomycetes bacterium]|nr:hypothetical protein [Planctomycetota bacterium]
MTSRSVMAACVSAAILSGFGGTAAAADDRPLLRVRVETNDPVALEGRLEREGFDVLEGAAGESTLDVIVTDADLAALRERGFDVKIINRGRPLRDVLAEREAADGVPSGYGDYDAIVAQMNVIAGNFPPIARVVDLTTDYGMPTTVDGRHIYAMKISDNPAIDEDEPAVLIVSAHHAREIVTPVIALEAMDRLTQTWGLPGPVTTLVNSTEIFIVPVWNPDGYQYVFDTDFNWRKNRRVFVDGTGVDLNRNYSFGWNTACSGSTSAGSNTYKGPEAASEVETQTMMAWSLAERFAKVIDYHSSGQEVLWGYASCRSHPLDAWWLSEAIALSNASGYGGDERLPSADGEHYQWQFGQLGAHAFLIETATSFQPSFVDAETEADTVWPGILHMLQAPIPLSGNVTDSVLGNPMEATITNVSLTYTNGETNTSGGAYGRYYGFYPSGVYTIEFSAPGYHTQTHPVTITVGGQVELDVVMVPSVTGDVNFDGVVNFADILTLIGMWGPCPFGDCAVGDFNQNGMIDFGDILVLIANWTQ